MSNPVRGNLFEKPETIKARRTSRGGRNPRYVTAILERKAALARMKELSFKIWTKKEIKQEYTDERVEALLKAARANLKLMRGPIADEEIPL